MAKIKMIQNICILDIHCPQRQLNKIRGLRIVKYHEVEYNFNHPFVSWWEIATPLGLCK